MKRNGLRNGRASTIPGGMLFGAMIGTVWTLTMSGLLGWLIHRQILDEKALGYGSMVILLTASVLAATVSYGKIQRQRAFVCLGTGVVYLLILVGINAFFFGGQYAGFGVTGILVLGGSAVAIFITMGWQNRKAGKGRKIRL